MPITNATFTPANATMLHLLQGGVPVAQGGEILKEVMANSLMMRLAKYVEMDKTEKEFDVFLNGIGAYWVGEGQRIQTTKPTWKKVKMVSHKLGVILPVSREYLNYKQKDFFNKMKPYIAEAFYKKFDAATFLNADNPFAQSIKGSVGADLIQGDLNLANFDKAVGNINDAGYEPNAAVSKVQNASLLKPIVRDDNGLKYRLYDGQAMDGIKIFDLHRDIEEFKKGSLILGDFDQVYYGVPYNMSYAISQDATLTTIKGDDGEPLNLFEREMVALRVTMDVAFLVLKDDAFAMIEPTTP